MKAEIKLEKDEIVKAIGAYVRAAMPGVHITDVALSSYSAVSATVTVGEPPEAPSLVTTFRGSDFDAGKEAE